jgi:predicted O-methyltransferase YrrM
VKCLLGDALALMPTVAKEYGAADMIFIDGKPSEYLQYLQVAEACGLVRPGTRVIADNAQVFASFKGVKEYLEYVRTSGKYETETMTQP